jgi:2-isopropylmalate synthase
VRHARSPRIHTFLATSPIHMEKKLRMEPSQVIEHAVRAVRWAGEYTDNVEFSPEDAGRSDIDFLCRILEKVIAAGATTINIPDTVGYTLPEHFGQVIRSLRERIPNSDKVVWSVHCHNDLGLAVANSLSAILAGARQVECTINGLGERAGNASLEEIVMAVRTRQDIFSCDTNIDATQIVPASRLVSTITGFAVQPNKAIVGANAFAHEAGIHQHGVLMEKSTYEIMTPESIGLTTNKLVLGKHSGRHAFIARLKELGYELSKEDVEKAFVRFKALADLKKEIFDEDLDAIVADEIVRVPETIKLVQMSVSSGSFATPTATVELEINGKIKKAAVLGDGPVDATFKAIKKLARMEPKLLHFGIGSITGGTDALGECTVRLEVNGREVLGQGAHSDIIVASAKAFINALNKGLSKAKRNPHQL